MRSILMKKSVKKHWFYQCYQWTPATPRILLTPLTQKCVLAAVRSGCSCLRFEKSAVAAVRREFCPTQNRARGTKNGHGPKKSVARCGCTEKRSSTKSVLWLHREASFVQKKIGPGPKFPGFSQKILGTLWLQREAGFHVFCSKSMVWLQGKAQKKSVAFSGESFGPELAADGGDDAQRKPCAVSSHTHRILKLLWVNRAQLGD